MSTLADLVLDLIPSRTRAEDPVATTIAVDAPLEVSVRSDAAGRVTIGASAPTQTFETGLLPVFHRMELSMEVEDA